jgi:DNA-directed RNA polymerase omega subunit
MDQQLTKKSSIDKVDIDACMKKLGVDRFKLIVIAANKARQIANKRNFAERSGAKVEYENRPTVQALIDILEGTE